MAQYVSLITAVHRIMTDDGRVISIAQTELDVHAECPCITCEARRAVSERMAAVIEASIEASGR